MKINFPDNKWGKKTGIVSKQLNLTLPEVTIPQIEQIALANGYKTTAEFIKQCIKNELLSLGHKVETNAD